MTRTAALLAILTAAPALTGCGAEGGPTGPANGFPVTVANCGHPVTLERAPERIVALGPSEVTTLWTAGAAPKLVGRDDAGRKSDPYPPDLRAAVATVPQLGSGGELTRENVIALSPDLVVGSVSETINPDTLAAVGIPMISLSGNCGSAHAPGVGDGTADFDDVTRDVELFGRLLGDRDRANAAVAALRQRITRATPTTPPAPRTAAAVIVFKNGLEVYGRQSMAHTQLSTLGLTDVFGDTPQRVFEANIEELIARNPQVVMILSYGQTDAEAQNAFLSIPGAASLAAVRDRALFVQPYEFSSQGSLSVNGLENMAGHLTNPR